MFLFIQWNFSIVYCSTSIIICFPLCHLFLNSDEPLPLYFARKVSWILFGPQPGAALVHRDASGPQTPGRQGLARYITERTDYPVVAPTFDVWFFDGYAVACNGR